MTTFFGLPLEPITNFHELRVLWDNRKKKKLGIEMEIEGILERWEVGSDLWEGGRRKQQL